MSAMATELGPAPTRRDPRPDRRRRLHGLYGLLSVENVLAVVVFVALF